MRRRIYIEGETEDLYGKLMETPALGKSRVGAKIGTMRKGEGYHVSRHNNVPPCGHR
jgi:hypothetical protein